MPTYIALLRGINVSGQKKIKMAELRQHLAALNYSNLRTYIQSGNIVFEAEGFSVEELQTQISNTIRDQYGFVVDVLVKQPEELAATLAHNPFAEETADDPKQPYVTYLAETPGSEQLAALMEKAPQYAPDQFTVVEDRIYSYFPNGAGKAKISNNLYEQKLKVSSTTRNWRTVQVLLDMAHGKI